MTDPNSNEQGNIKTVREEVERLGGSISVSSKVDEGTQFVIKLPILN